MQARDPRHPSNLDARVRGEEGWSDARILDVSNRGLGLWIRHGATRGRYVEIRRRDVLVVGRVVWTKGDRVGIWCQDPVPPDLGGCAAVVVNERRNHGRRSTDRLHEQARQLGRRLEQLMLVGAGLAAGIVVVTVARDGLARPLSAIEAALEPRGEGG